MIAVGNRPARIDKPGIFSNLIVMKHGVFEGNWFALTGGILRRGVTESMAIYILGVRQMPRDACRGGFLWH
jgi:hypothetical protein